MLFEVFVNPCWFKFTCAEPLSRAISAGETNFIGIDAGKSPIRACSDIVLYTSSDETKYNILALNSRIAQLAIINVIYYYVVVHRSERAAEAIRETERSLKSKKF